VVSELPINLGNTWTDRNSSQAGLSVGSNVRGSVLAYAPDANAMSALQRH
jgi:hypothetical protein